MSVEGVILFCIFLALILAVIAVLLVWGHSGLIQHLEQYAQDARNEVRLLRADFGSHCLECHFAKEAKKDKKRKHKKSKAGHE